ncbi:Os03g0860801 [Oryza sativa Japonica Group]|uniref:Os03g0860801 protein n=1 Tax=Oryza sativa subsp. japonica TaxID=39947 RepID=A0A0P0W5U4_ORYSJ|nr:hypothetical protein EE612_021799 [Oryza sativa]BAS87486.1 Os03g0860801 [Oryza sativa Japonica Group]
MRAGPVAPLVGMAEVRQGKWREASKSRFVVGSHVWVEDPDEAWMDGLVEEINENDLVVNCTSGKKVTINVGSAYPKDTESPRGGVEDMTRLAYLHEPGVLQNLKSRYALNEIYDLHSQLPFLSHKCDCADGEHVVTAAN